MVVRNASALEKRLRSPLRARRNGGRRKRNKTGLEDGKTFKLYCAGCALLSERDFDDMSVSRFAKAGGCSVGAFYGRFSDKKAFLDFLIRETFRQAERRAEHALSENAALKTSFEKSMRKIAEYISAKFAEEEFAGVIRAAIKLGFSDPKSRAPFDEYREAVTERPIGILAPHLRRGSETRVREAMQAVFGILTDAVISRSVQLAPGTGCMTEALSSVIVEIARRRGKPSPKPEKRGRQNKEKSDKVDIAAPKSSQKKPRRRKIAVI